MEVSLGPQACSLSEDLEQLFLQLLCYRPPIHMATLRTVLPEPENVTNHEHRFRSLFSSLYNKPADSVIRHVCTNWGLHSVGMSISKSCPCSSLFFLLSHFCVSSFLVSAFLPFTCFLCLLSFSLSRTLWLFWFFLKITCNNHKIPWILLPTPPPPQPQMV